MSNPTEQSPYSDSELEILLAGVSLSMQQNVRKIINDVRPILSPEEWKDVRNGLINDLKMQQEKTRLEDKMTELTEKMDKLIKNMEEIKELKKKLDSFTNE